MSVTFSTNISSNVNIDITIKLTKTGMHSFMLM